LPVDILEEDEDFQGILLTKDGSTLLRSESMILQDDESKKVEQERLAQQ